MSRISLDANEARVLGVLLEKQVTTPDVYPLTLNALTLGCNQKSNRDPVMALREGAVRDAVESLISKTLAREQGSAGGRTRRFSHRLDSRLFGELEFSKDERAVLCVLLLRGPQTPGEIRARSERLANFAGLPAVEAVLERLATRADGPHVEVLVREPGRREQRYRELLTAEEARPAAHVAAPQAPAAHAARAGSDELERRLADIEARLEAIEARLGCPPNAAAQNHAPEDEGAP